MHQGQENFRSKEEEIGEKSQLQPSEQGLQEGKNETAKSKEPIKFGRRKLHWKILM